MSQELKDKIMQAIKKGEVHMRPRWHFLLRGALQVLGLLIGVFLAIYVVSLIHFMLRTNGLLVTPLFGLRGIRVFLFSLPWILVLLALSSVLVVELLTRFYGFSRRLPLLYGALGVIVFVSLASIGVAKTSLHSTLFLRSMNGRMPVMAPIYHGFGEPKEVTRGQITGFDENQFFLLGRKEREFTVKISRDTRFPHGMNFVEGDSVVVFGPRNELVIVAEGVLRVDHEMFDPVWKEGMGKGKRLYMLRDGGRGEGTDTPVSQ